MSIDRETLVFTLRHVRDNGPIYGPSPDSQQPLGYVIQAILPYCHVEPLGKPLEGLGTMRQSWSATAAAVEVHTDDLPYLVTHRYTITEEGRDFLQRHRHIHEPKGDA